VSFKHTSELNARRQAKFRERQAAGLSIIAVEVDSEMLAAALNKIKTIRI
jgi:hypothetical protein